MARPRVFISSTFYDLKQIRADLDNFIRSLGYDVVRNEEGAIPYEKDFRLEEYCYKRSILSTFLLPSLVVDSDLFLLQMKDIRFLIQKSRLL